MSTKNVYNESVLEIKAVATLGSEENSYFMKCNIITTDTIVSPLHTKELCSESGFKFNLFVSLKVSLGIQITQAAI